MTDMYKTPDATLTESPEMDGFGSLERGKAGDYQFVIGDIIREAWRKTKGAKGTVWLALLLYGIIMIPVTIGVPWLLEMAGMPSQQAPGAPFDPTLLVGLIVAQIISIAITLPLGAGLFMLGLKLASGVPVSATEVFGYFHKVLPLLVTVVVMYIMLIIGFILLIIPGIYLAVAYYLAIPLVVEKGLGPWQALEASRKAISKCWFRFFGLGFTLTLLMIVAAIPLGIGLIWVMPLLIIAFGIVYRNIFGLEGAAST